MNEQQQLDNTPKTKRDWESYYAKIISYEISPNSDSEYKKARAWHSGAEINDRGDLVETQDTPASKPKTSVFNPSSILNIKAVSPSVIDEQPRFKKDGQLFYGGFKDYYDAYNGTSEICESFMMATALSQVGVILGRRACISMGKVPSKRFRIYPNFYNVIVGPTSIARKSSCLRQLQLDVRFVDMKVRFMDSIASAEGLVSALATDEDGNPIETYSHNCPEGSRTILCIDEFRSLLLNARRQVSSTIIPKLTEIFNCPPSISINTKLNPITAQYPTFSILAASTKEWLAETVTTGDVGGGFVNRFGYFLYEWTPSIPNPADPHEVPLLNWYERLDMCRQHGDNLRNFVLSPDAWEIYKEEYDTHRRRLFENQEDFEALATTREMTHSFKIALAFAAVTNDPSDNTVTAETWLYARAVANYISTVNAFLFKSVGADERSHDEQLVLKHLANLGNDTSRSRLRMKIGGKQMSLETFNTILKTLQEAGILVVTESRPQRIVRIEE